MNKDELYEYVKISLSKGVTLDVIKGTILSEGKGHISDVDEIMVRINKENNASNPNVQVADINWLGPKVIHPTKTLMPEEYVRNQEKNEKLYWIIGLVVSLLLIVGGIVYAFQKDYVRVRLVPLGLEFGKK